MPLKISATGQKAKKTPKSSKVLLVAPPAYDIRLEWSQWHQPIGILQLASLLVQHKKDVRLIDCLHSEQGRRLPRHKIDTQEIEGYKFHKWHFGLPFDKLEAQVRGLLEEKWKPNTIYVTTLNSIWWESTRDTVKLLKKLLPKARIVLGGAYPTLEPEHAKQHSGAHKIVSGSFPEATKLPPDLSLYQEVPYSAGICFYSHLAIHETTKGLRRRRIKEIVKEIKQKAELGVREFVFFDEEIRFKDRDKFGKLLNKIAKAKLDAHFVFPGNISPRMVTQDLAGKMRRARVTRVYLRCDLQFDLGTNPYTTALPDYERCVKALAKKGGFEPRQGNLAAMLVVGLPYEDLDAVSERLIRLAHIVGSVILVPFQYVPGLHKGPLFDRALAQNGSFSPEKFNSKLFPLARLSGKKLEDYMELTRLAALLNSKYRSKTFDFLGDGLSAKMFRESIRTKGWDPFRKTDDSGEAPEAMSLDLPVMMGEGIQHDYPG